MAQRSHHPSLRPTLIAGMLFAVVRPAGGPTSAAPAPPTSPFGGVTVPTTEGPVVGVRGEAATTWKGIPYAAPPVGPLRWRAPQVPAVREMPLDASELGPACPQDERSALNPGGGGRQGAEDCLTLNIWAPNDAAGPLPVLFWLHGGGHIQGSGGDPLYDGASLAGEQAVVVVTINYRLGALGFLVHEAFIGEHADHPTAGNWGRLDQIAALKWVRANIAGFGGDPGRIAIFGESAGGLSVCDLMVSPLSNGLFAGAIVQSGGCQPLAAVPIVDQPRGALAPATDQGRRFASAIGCAGTPDVAACLRGKPVDDILGTLPGEIGILKPGAEVYGAVIDRHALVEAPAEAFAAGRQHPVPFLLGANADEGTIFLTEPIKNMTAAQYAALVRNLYGDLADDVLAVYPASAYASPGLAVADITGDAGFVCPTRRVARWHAAGGHAAYLYHFTYVSAVSRQRGLGAFHGSEIPFVFGNLGQGGGTRLPPAVERLSDAMRGYWANLAAEGSPGTVAGLTWPRYDAADDVAMRFDTPPALETGWRAAKCDVWDAVATRDAVGTPTPSATVAGTPGPVPTASPTDPIRPPTVGTPATSAPWRGRVFLPYVEGA